MPPLCRDIETEGGTTKRVLPSDHSGKRRSEYSISNGARCRTTPTNRALGGLINWAENLGRGNRTTMTRASAGCAGKASQDEGRAAACHREAVHHGLIRSVEHDLACSAANVQSRFDAYRTGPRDREVTLFSNCSVACSVPELRVRVRHLKAKGTLRHATVKGLITD